MQNNRLLFLLPLLTLLLSACGGLSRLDSPDAGRTYTFVPGVPNFDMEAIARWEQEQTGVDLYISIPHASLVFLRAGSGFEARYEALIQVFNRKTKEIVRQVEKTDTIRVATYAQTQAYRPYVFYERLPLPAGDYLIRVTVTDMDSGKQALRQQRIQVVALQEEPYLSRIRLDVKRPDEETFEPALALHLPSDMDSLRAVVYLYNARAGGEVTLQLLRFESDTTIAAPPYWLSPAIGSLRYKGVEYDRADTLQVTHRRLENIGDEVEIEFILPGLRRGIYRIAIQSVVHTPEADVVVSRYRDISIKGPGFPRLVTLDELVDALAYIAYDREIAYIKEAPTPREKKRRFDAFWGTLVQNRQVAANLLKLYYSRVEEANLFFTTYKEGWKTDRGMIYIIFGPPVLVENKFDEEIWYYSYAERDPLNTFRFERARPYGAYARFENFFLVRSPIYEPVWTRAIERWRAGAVL